MKNDKGHSGFLDTARLRDRAKDLLTERFSNPTARVLSGVGFTPNKVTIAGGLIAVAAGALAAKGRLPEAGALVLAAGALDLVDGAMARLTGKQSKFGAVLDSTFDRLGEAAVLFGLLALYSGLGQTPYVLLVFAAMFGSVLVSYIKARAEGEGIDCNVGLLSRGERVVLMGLGLLINQVPAVLVILTFFSYVTAAQRLWRVKKATEEAAQNS